MRQVSQSYRTGKLALVDTATPRAPAGGVLVDTTVSLISAGTERAIVDMARKNLLVKAKDRPDLVAKVLDKAKREGVLSAFDAVRTKLDNPIPLGYSLAGRVAEVGAGAPGFARGDRVACAGAGFANHAEVNAVPLNLVVRVPDGVTDEEASFVTVGAIALHGVRLARPTLGASVVVIGLGLLGQITVQLLAAHGCDVIGVDLDPAKVERAKARGAVAGVVPSSDDPVEVVRAFTGGIGADAVVVTASSPTNEPLVTAGEVARDRARVVAVGVMPIEVPRKTYYDKELELVVSRSYGPGRHDPAYEERGHDYPIGYVRWTERRNFEAVLRAIETKRLDVLSLVTHRFPFEDALDAYAVVTGERPEPHLGVLLTYPERAARPAAAAEVRSEHVRRDRSTLGVAMVGTGAFASGVLLPALAKIPGAKLVATVSGRGLSARHAADRFGAEHVLSDIDAALALPAVDAVMIATRHSSHAAQAAKALAAGRDVFLEKPAAIDEAQLATLAEAVAGARGRLQVGFNRRFAPFAVAVRDAFSGRRAGLVMVARINAGRVADTSWLADAAESGGRIVGEGCHFVDLMSYWAGSSPVRVSAHGLGAEGAYRRDDNVIATLTFADGSVGTLIYTAMGDPSVPKESYEVFCEGKIARLNDWRALSLTERGKTRTTRALRADKGHAAQLAAFVRACNTGGSSPIPWASIEATTRATFAIERARLENVSVEL
ncbi:bi-domain-containing oxidoreductase [Sorangium sp. So ce1036]|uniref:bi-domain-containing oxidoreductase n=1 Tax=Sorangium sp. So ce1036 TaxID=3133328 RepID=UPI003F03A3D9